MLVVNGFSLQCKRLEIMNCMNPKSWRPQTSFTSNKHFPNNQELKLALVNSQNASENKKLRV